MKIGITCGGFGPYANGEFIRASASAAEKAGFAHYWFPEHVVQFAEYPQSRYPYAEGSGQEKPDQDSNAPLKYGEENPIPDPRTDMADPVIAMTWAAAATTTLEVGSNILILPQRNPLNLAKALATLDSFCNGRVLLGAGVGWAKEESDAVGVDFSNRGKRMDEIIAVMRELWRSEASSFSGESFRFAEAYCYPKPVRPGGVPILIGGESKAALNRVARIGDGWLPFNLPVEDAASVIGKLKDATKRNDRDPSELRIIKIIFSNAKLDDLKRYRDAGVTEFNLGTSGELPLDAQGIESQMAEYNEALVQKVAAL